MVSKYYRPGMQRSEGVHDLFARVASRYDLLNDLQSLGLHRRWKSRLVHMAAPIRGELALDLCCGTGDLAFLLARAGVEVVGVDFSGPMLSKASEKASTAEQVGGCSGRGDGRLVFCRGDAQALPFSDGTFDLVTIAYGLRNLVDWKEGLREMWRVMRPGGRLLALEFGKPPNALWRALYYGYLRCGVPLLGRLFCGDAQAYGYILESLRHYPGQERVAAELKALGGEDLQLVQPLGGAMSIHFARKSGPTLR